MNFWPEFIKLKTAVGGNREALHYEESFGMPLRGGRDRRDRTSSSNAETAPQRRAMSGEFHVQHDLQ